MNILSQKSHRYGGRHLGFILTLLEVFIGCLIQNIFSANQIHKTTTYGFMDFFGSPREVTQVKLSATRPGNWDQYDKTILSLCSLHRQYDRMHI